jgi:deazaflavin-dependent oxidoreductase (nitroreductase family)
MSSLDTASPPSGGRARAPASRPPWGAKIVHLGARAFMATGARVLNPHVVRLAGSARLPLLGVVHHRGRRSGRAYATPVVVRPTADGFVIPLTFGEGTDWFQNLLEAGGGVVRWRGADYALIAPEIVDWATGQAACRLPERTLMRLIGIEQFARLRHACSARGHQQVP